MISARDLTGVGDAIRLAVSPLEFDDLDDWRAAVNRALAPLLAADSVGFMLPVADRAPMFSEEHDASELARFTDLAPPPTADGRPVWERVVVQGVSTLESLYHEDVAAYMESAYYNEYASVNGAHDTLSLSLSLGEHDPMRMASLSFWHARRGGRKFGGRERAILEVLRPALEAGSRTALRMIHGRHALLASLDRQTTGALLFDPAGRLLHRNDALHALAVTTRAERLLVRKARSMACALASEDVAHLVAPAATRCTLRTRARDYELSAVRFVDGVFAPCPVVLVNVEPCAPAPLPDRATLCTRFGLTRRQAEVALLLAARKSGPEIAEILSLSPHTVRHHTHAVMGRLGVGDRRDVGAMLRSQESVVSSQ